MFSTYPNNYFYREDEGYPLNDGYFPVNTTPIVKGAQPYLNMEHNAPINAGTPSTAPGGTTQVPPYPVPTPQHGTDQQGGQSDFEMAPGSPVIQDINYTQGFLRTQIGKRVLISFLIGTNTYQDRSGVLETVGISYIILREEGNTRLLCDIYSIKFVRIFP